MLCLKAKEFQAEITWRLICQVFVFGALALAQPATYSIFNSYCLLFAPFSVRWPHGFLNYVLAWYSNIDYKYNYVMTLVV